LFADALNGDWHVSPASPCINAGEMLHPDQYPASDFDGNPRISHGQIDIGPYEYHREKIFVSGTFTADTSWIADTVIVENHVIINNEVKLAIAPGTTVLMDGYFFIEIRGFLHAMGNEMSRITFTVADTNGFSNLETPDGSWAGFRINSYGIDDDSTIITYCDINHVNIQYGAMSLSSGLSIRIDHCRFYDNYGPNGASIKISGCNPVITNNEFYNHHQQTEYDEIIHITSECAPVLKNNHFHHNFITAVSVHGSLPAIENNIFEYNENEFGTGIICDGSNPRIIGNIFRNNKGLPLIITDNSEPAILNNIICNNSVLTPYGPSDGIAAMYVDWNSNPLLINNTICNNLTSGNNAVYVSSHCNATMINNIFWGNGSTGEEYYDLFIYGTNQSEIRNNIIFKGESGIWIEGFGSTIENNMDTLPLFVSPTSGAGAEFDAGNADWSLLSISPAINAGLVDMELYSPPANDLLGNIRIWDEKIDLGSIENTQPVFDITEHPRNQIKCEFDSVVLNVESSDTAWFQWQKDGIDITSATGPSLKITDLDQSDQGNYQCIISNMFGTRESNPAYLLVTIKPEFILEPTDLWAENGKQVTLRSYAKGSNLSFQWKKNLENIPEAFSPELIFNSIGSGDEGVYHCVIQNTCGSDSTEKINLFIVPQICMVTVSLITGNNLVVWEKNSTAPLTEFNIYRESTAAGIYDLMATVPASDLSVWEDTTADPTKRAYIYKLTGTDTSGYETPLDLCKPHKTIHLLVSTNPELNSTQLLWDRYFGFDYQTYTIYRSTTQSNFTIVDFMPSSLNSWTETDAGDLEVFYRVSVQKPDPCIPTGGGKKADSGPYSHALSNVDDNRLQAGQAPPDTILLSNHSIDENNMIGALIGKLSTVDADTIDIHTYQLIPGEGDEGNGAFTLIGELLVAGDYFDYETQDNYSIRIRCTDKYDNIREEIFAITVNDVSEPTGYQQYSTQPIMVYPNPFNTSTTVVFPNPNEKEYRLVVTDLSGKVVRSIDNITTSSFILQKENLEKGLYLIELRGTRIYRGRIVIE